MDDNELEKFKSMTDEELSKLPADEFLGLCKANRDQAFKHRLWGVTYVRQCEFEAEADDPAQTTTDTL
jgi:hypothetical protein